MENEQMHTKHTGCAIFWKDLNSGTEVIASVSSNEKLSNEKRF